MTAAAIPDAPSPSTEAPFRLLVDSLTDWAVCMLDLDGVATTWNPAAARIIGHSAEGAIGQHLSLLFTEEDRAAQEPERALDVAARTGRFETEGWRLRKGGARFWAGFALNAARDASGRLVGFAMLVQDLSERRRQEEERRQTEASFQRLVDGVTDYAIFLLDPGGRVVTWNGGARRIKGYTTQEAVGLHLSAFYPPDARAAGLPAKALAEAERAGRSQHEGWRVRKDGSRFWAAAVIDAIREDGELVGFAKVTRDVTERRAAEEALKASYVRVERLTQALDDKEVLLQEVHHRVKNNLQVVCALLVLQSRATADATARTALTEAASRIQAMSLIHERLYGYENASSIDFGDYLAKLAQGVAAAHASPEREIEVAVSPSDVRLDLNAAVPLSLIANELIGNAFKHAFEGRGTGRIEVALDRTPEGVELRIEDDGRGGAIPPLDEAKSVGLQIVRALSRQLDASVEHRDERGARFVIRVPLRERANGAAEAAQGAAG